MSLDALKGRSYGPATFSTASALVERYVAATGEDPGRWADQAPRSIAGAMLFVVAPRLLADPDLEGAARSVIHGDQTFTWARPIPLDRTLEVTGIVTRVRERSGVAFVGFELEVLEAGEAVVSGSSTFLMSGDSPPAGEAGEEVEPDPDAGSELSPALAADVVDGSLAPLARSASRSDLVRYAAASQDFNPIHWDHAAAVAAGLPGVVVHGLLQSAWACQAVERTGVDPVTARFRYRAPLRPAVAVTVEGGLVDGGVDVRLVDRAGREYVAGAFRF
ncbi:MAG: MaoC/PaaZ C-terminal domain-containing protein, partial [Acidimicrobiia bacterium]|nr:MaoC/PaaZ C-terminal domain-containing protein [Acidimicrobiia bacterium]